MAKKVSKNQRTDRGKNRQENRMAKIVVSVKKENGQYAYVNKFVSLHSVTEELKAARA